MAKKEQSTNQFLDALKILANKLDKKQYNKVTSVMFRLYMGDKIGYRSTFDPQVMADINAVWQFGREKKEKESQALQIEDHKGWKK